jgi:hypothetical protein
MALGYRQRAFQGYRSVTHGGWRYFESIQSVRQCSPLLFRGENSETRSGNAVRCGPRRQPRQIIEADCPYSIAWLGNLKADGERIMTTAQPRFDLSDGSNAT